MKKNFRFVLALVLAAMMIAGSISALAADVVPASDAHLPVNSSSYDSTISVTGLDAGDTVNYYKIVEWVGSQSGNVKGWKATSDFASVLDETTLKQVLGVDLAAGQTAGISASLASLLAAAANGKTAAYTDSNIATTTSTMSTSANTAPGIYMAIVTPVNKDTIYGPVFVSCDFDKTNASNSQLADTSASYSDSAAVKKQTTTLEKEATASDDAWDKKYAAGAVAVGDTVNFTVTTTIPAYGAFEYPKFDMTDTLTDLELVTGTVKVYESNGTTQITSGFSVTENANHDGYKISFTSDYLKRLASPKPIVVKYDALVTTDALRNVNVEKNEVYTEFANNPSNSSDYDVKKDITKHYTFTIDANSLFGSGWTSGEKGTEIVKIGRDAAGNIITSEKTYSNITNSAYQESPLAGAQFKLYTDAACSNEYIPLKKDGTPDSPLNLTSDADGRINIPGLDAGTYYLLETKAPDGFIKSNTPVEIDISATFRPVTNTEYFNGTSWSNVESAGSKSYTYTYQELESYSIKINGVETTTHTFLHDSTWAEMSWTDNGSKEIPSSIVNVRGVELPSTGGIGTTIFYVGGSILVLAAAILLITKRRMGAED